MTKFATVSMHCEFDKAKNLRKILELTDRAADNGADIVVFPESALCGYLRQLHRIHTLAADKLDEYWYQYENAEPVPDGPSVRALMEKAAQRDIYIVAGMTRKDGELPHKLYNSAVLVGPEGFIGKHDKVHQPVDELHIFYPGREFPVFETRFGRVGLMICYDKNYPEAAREMVLQGAEVLICCTAWGFEGGMDADPETDLSYRNYDLFDRVRAIENQRFFLSSNQFGPTATMSLFGHANIVDPRGVVVATTGFAEGIAYYETHSIQEEVYRGCCYNFGLNMVKDRVPRAYRHLLDDEAPHQP